MRNIKVGSLAAYILTRGKTEHPSQYKTNKGIIENVLCGGIKMPMRFETFGRLNLQNGGPAEGRTVYLNGISEVEGKWDLTEQVVTIFGVFPESVATQQRIKMEQGPLLIGDVADLPFHQERQIRNIIRDDDRITYHLERDEKRLSWEDFLASIEGLPEPSPGILDHMK